MSKWLQYVIGMFAISASIGHIDVFDSISDYLYFAVCSIMYIYCFVMGVIASFESKQQSQGKGIE